MFAEAQSIWQMCAIDQRKMTHQQKAEKMEKIEKVVRESQRVEKTEKERSNNLVKFRKRVTLERT